MPKVLFVSMIIFSASTFAAGNQICGKPSFTCGTPDHCDYFLTDSTGTTYRAVSEASKVKIENDVTSDNLCLPANTLAKLSN